MHEIRIYTDGSSSWSGDSDGGWGLVRINYTDDVISSVTELGGHLIKSTNNYAELKAVLEALRLTKVKSKTKLTIHTDSQYVAKGANHWIYRWRENGFRNSSLDDVRNRSMFEEVRFWMDEHERHKDFKLVWIKGHSGNVFNDRADEIAGNARRNMINSRKLNLTANQKQVLKWRKICKYEKAR